MSNLANIIIEFDNVTKIFGDTIANENVSFSILKNEVHALLGENGAGKSTIMSILFGLYSRNKGTIKLNGKVIDYPSPKYANNDGISMLPQHFKLIENMSVWENIIVGSELHIGPIIDSRSAKVKLKEIMHQYKLNVAVDAIVSELSVSDKQKIEILKILWRNADIIILDEPTSILTPLEIENFLKLVKEFKRVGKTVIIITHKLDEVKKIADRCTIMRKGKVVKTINAEDVNEHEIAKLMVGQAVDLNLSSISRNKFENRKTILKVQHLSYEPKGRQKGLAHLNFDIHAGEILGVAAVEGNGQSELFNVLSGALKQTNGSIIINGMNVSDWSIKERYQSTPLDEKERQDVLDLRWRLKDEFITLRAEPIDSEEHRQRLAQMRRQLRNFRIVAKRKNSFISHIPEDRQAQGLILDFTCSENAVLQDIENYKQFGFFLKGDANKKLDDLIEKYDVRGINDYKTNARVLSGGNQQKIIIGREIERQSSLLLAFNPTRGLDVGAIRNVYSKIIDSRNSGSAILLHSGELDEIMQVSDKIAIMHQGKIVGIFPSYVVTKDDVGLAMLTGKLSDHMTKYLDGKLHVLPKQVVNKEVASKQTVYKEVVHKEPKKAIEIKEPEVKKAVVAHTPVKHVEQKVQTILPSVEKHKILVETYSTKVRRRKTPYLDLGGLELTSTNKWIRKRDKKKKKKKLKRKINPIQNLEKGSK